MGIVSHLCLGVRLAADLFSVAKKVYQTATEPDSGKTVPTALSALAISIDALSRIAVSSEETRARMKGIEFAAHVCRFPYQIEEALQRYDQGEISGLEAAEEGLLAPAATILRSGTEHALSHYKHLLSLPPQERHDLFPGGKEKEAPVPLRTESECRERIESAARRLPLCHAVEMTLKTKTASFAFSTLEAVYEKVKERAALLAMGGANEDPFEGDFLLRLPFIPAALYNDPILSQYECPISTVPIRDPVRDPTNGMTLYERRSIAAWLETDPTSPITRQPLYVQDLQEVPALRSAIEDRLRLYQGKILEAIQGNLLPNGGGG